MRDLILAFQFMTRLPMPALPDLGPDAMARAAGWFPLVGLVVGALVALPLIFIPDPRLAALLALVVWVGVTGGLHLDGLADLTDALGAAHRDRERFLAVLADPHIGSFGVMALVLQLIAKFVLLWLLAEAQADWWTLPLIAAWARLGALVWSQSLPPLKPGLGAQVAQSNRRWVVVVWGVLLLWPIALSAFALLLLLAGWAFLRYRLGGMSGDALGAGIELVEGGLLVCVLMV